MTICSICGGEVTTPHVVTTTGLLEGEWGCHESCFDGFMVEFEEKRAQLQELIDSGVPRDNANEIMIARMDSVAPS